MTTAHRATFKPATGGNDQGGNRLTVPSRQFSSKDMPGHTVLKERGLEQVAVHHPQGSKAELSKIDYKSELLKRERIAQLEKTEKNIKKDFTATHDIRSRSFMSFNKRDGGFIQAAPRRR